MGFPVNLLRVGCICLALILGWRGLPAVAQAPNNPKPAPLSPAVQPAQNHPPAVELKEPPRNPDSAKPSPAHPSGEPSPVLEPGHVETTTEHGGTASASKPERREPEPEGHEPEIVSPRMIPPPLGVPDRGSAVPQESTRGTFGAGASSVSSAGSSSCCSRTSTVPQSGTHLVPGVPIAERPHVTGAYAPVTASGGRIGSVAASAINGSASALTSNIHPVYSVPAGSTAGFMVHENGAVVPSRFGRLNQQAAAAVIEQVNQARSSMKGINRIPLPGGNVVAQPNGNLAITPTPGHFISVRADGTVASVRSFPPLQSSSSSSSSTIARRQQSVLFDHRGRVAEVHNSSVDIYHGPHGIRTIVAKQPDGKVLVSTGAHSGYLEDSFSAGGASYLRRAYIEGNSHFVRIYRAYDYHGHRYYRYIPAWSYPTEFHTWFRGPWYPPVIYKWFPRPPKLQRVYDHYYPMPFVNLNARDWIVDYLFIQIFNDAGETDGADYGSDANTAGSQDSGDGDTVYADADTPVTPELKQSIGDEALEALNDDAADDDPSDQWPQDQGPTELWTPNHYFVVGNPMEVATEDGHTCLLDAGNVLRLDSAPSWPPANAVSSMSPQLPGAKLTVVASRRSDCPADTRTNVPLDQLEEMENGFRARLDDGLQTLYGQQGQNGLPTIPNSGAATAQALYATPADDNNLQTLLSEQQNGAAQAESDARSFAAAELASSAQR